MMNHKPLIVKQSQSQQFDNIEEGQYPCICTSVIDMGTHETVWNNVRKKKHYIRFIFTFPTETYLVQGEPKPHKVTVTHTMSLNSKGNLLPFLQAWRGKAFTEDELLDGVDMSQFLGMTMLGNIGHTRSGDKTFANIISCMPLPKAMECPKIEDELIFYSVQDHNETMFQKLSQKTKEKLLEADEMQIGSGANTEESIHDYSSDKIGDRNRVAIEDVPF